MDEKETIIFVNRSSKYHRNGNMSFHEDKAANILKNFGYRIIIISTSFKIEQNKNIIFNEGYVTYVYLKNCHPEKITKEFEIELKAYLYEIQNEINFKNILGNSFDLYPVCMNIDYCDKLFIHNIHTPLSTTLEKNVNFVKKINNFYKFFSRIYKNYFIIKKILSKNNNKIVFSSINLKKLFVKENFLLFNNLNKKSLVIPLCLNTNISFNTEQDTKVKKYLNKININNKFPIITYIGRLSSKKGIETIIKAAIILKSNNIYPFFYIGGLSSENYEKKIRKLILNYKLDNIFFETAGVSNQETPYFYNNSDISIHLSNIFEGMSYSILEAMFNNCVVITNYSDEIIKDNAIFLNSNSASVLAKKLIELINNKNKIETIKKNARRSIVNKYNGKIFYDNLNKVFLSFN